MNMLCSFGGKSEGEKLILFVHKKTGVRKFKVNIQQLYVCHLNNANVHW